MLIRSTDSRPHGAKALGLGTSQPLATHAKYINLTNMGTLGAKDDDHEVFGKGAMNGQIYVCNFFTQVLTGMEVVLHLGDNVESIEKNNIFKIKAKSDPKAPCLKIPDLKSLE